MKWTTARLGSKGCALVGNPAYYPRFSFANTPDIFVPGVPPEVFVAILFDGPMPKGEVKFDEAFEAKG